MNRIKIVCLLALVSTLSAQLPIPSWAQWLSDDEKSWQVFTTKGGCAYEELKMPSLYRFRKNVVDTYIKEGWEITEENINDSIENYWVENTKHYPLQHIEDGYRMLRIVDASDVSEYHDGKVVVWEYYYKLKNVSSRKLTVSIKYNLTEEDQWGIITSDGMWFDMESGQTATFSDTDFFPIKHLERIESRSWEISYDY
jgi:hypothetical protein